MITFLSYFLCLSAPEAQELTVQTIDMVRNKYLWLDDLDVESAMVSAAEELEMHIPWMIVQSKEQVISLHVGQQEAFYSIDIKDLTLEEVEVKLFELILGVTKTSPLALPEDLDVELVLLDGFAREMDRYSVMMYKDRLNSFNERISGNFSGIGCRIRKHEQGLEVQEVFPDGPAYLMGLREGDIITQVDQVSLAALTLQQSVDRLRGETGSVVAIQYLREEQVRDMSLVRARVRVPNVHWTIQEDVGIITIRSFSEQTSRFLEKALESFEDTELKGLIIDLRNNGGGSMLQSCKVVDRFVTSGTTIKTVGRDGKSVGGLMKQYVNRNSFNESKLPMVVLINSNSASASEIVSGSFKLLDRALLVGQRTFGKGVVQTAADLRAGDDPVALKLTIAQYLLTGDYSVHEQDGVEPHVKVSSMDLSELPFVALSPEPSDLVLLEDGEDKQLDFAIDILQHATSAKVTDLQAVAQTRISEWTVLENQKIQQTLKDQGIEWGEGGQQSLQDIRVERLSDEIGIAGEKMTLSLRIHNSGELVGQSLLWLQAESSSSPWDDIVVPVGIIPARGSKDIEIPLDISHTTIPRYDKLQPTLLRSCCAEVEMNPLYVQIADGSDPRLAVSAEIALIEGHTYRLTVDLKNTGPEEMNEVYGRVIWPREAEAVRMKTNDWTLPTLAPTESHQQVLEFVSYDPLDLLPEVLLRVDTDTHQRLFRQEIDPFLLNEVQNLQPPVVHGIPPVMASTAQPFIFDHLIEDDGTVEAYEAWFNNEKIHWQDAAGAIQLVLPLEQGHNNLYLEITDNLGLTHKEVFTIFGVPEDSDPNATSTSEGGESHFGEDTIQSQER